MSVLEELTEDAGAAIAKAITPNRTGPTHDFDDLENDPFFTGKLEPKIDDAHSCKIILYQTMSEGSNVRLWDVLILIPTLAFLVFLLARFNHSRQKLRATNSPIFRAFYALVFVSAMVSVVRCLVSMTLSGSKAGDEADKILWILLRFFLLSTEMSVLVFGLATGHLDSRRSIRRVIFITSFVSFAFSITQGILELDFPDPNFHVEVAKMDLFGHGGMFFWLMSSAVFSVLYFTVLLLPFLPCRHYISLPNRKSFYYYATFLLVLNAVQSIGSILVYAGVPDGLCFVNLTTYLYFTAFTPIVYFTFLRGFFKVAQPSLLFSYKAQVDDFEGDHPHDSSVQLQHDSSLNSQEEYNSPIILSSQTNGFYTPAEANRIRNISGNEANNLANLGIASPNSIGGEF